MKPIHANLGSAAALALPLALAGCVPQPKSPPPVAPRPIPTATPTVAAAPASNDWMDAPQTPGDWSYTGGSAGGVAQFGETTTAARFTLRCEAAARSIVLSRAGQPAGAARMTIRTESQTRALAATPATTGVEARLAASDRLLDAMALSKGRFAVEVPGTPTLYLPSWAEVTRVIEDCR